MPRSPFKFRIVTPQGVVFSGRAEVAVLPGSEGDFAVLHGHAPLMAALGKGDMTVKAGEKTYRFYLDSGFVSTGSDETTVFTRKAEHLGSPEPQ